MALNQNILPVLSPPAFVMIGPNQFRTLPTSSSSSSYHPRQEPPPPMLQMQEEEDPMPEPPRPQESSFCMSLCHKHNGLDEQMCDELSASNKKSSLKCNPQCNQPCSPQYIKRQQYDTEYPPCTTPCSPPCNSQCNINQCNRQYNSQYSSQNNYPPQYSSCQQNNSSNYNNGDCCRSPGYGRDQMSCDHMGSKSESYPRRPYRDRDDMISDARKCPHNRYDNFYNFYNSPYNNYETKGFTNCMHTRQVPEYSASPV